MSDNLAPPPSETTDSGAPISRPSDQWGDPAARPKREITVLVVDDETGNATSLRKIFEREGMRVFTAENAKEALEVARRHRVEVVLTDLMMPGANGVDLLRALKE